MTLVTEIFINNALLIWNVILYIINYYYFLLICKCKSLLIISFTGYLGWIRINISWLFVAISIRSLSILGSKASYYLWNKVAHLSSNDGYLSIMNFGIWVNTNGCPMSSPWQCYSIGQTLRHMRCERRCTYFGPKLPHARLYILLQFLFGIWCFKYSISTSTIYNVWLLFFTYSINRYRFSRRT